MVLKFYWPSSYEFEFHSNLITSILFNKIKQKIVVNLYKNTCFSP